MTAGDGGGPAGRLGPRPMVTRRFRDRRPVFVRKENTGGRRGTRDEGFFRA
jgi:hypothetical protein